MRRNWYLHGKDTDRLYCIKQDANHGKSFSAAIFFDKMHDYQHRYELLRNGAVIAILFKENARIVGAHKMEDTDVIEIPLGQETSVHVTAEIPPAP